MLTSASLLAALNRPTPAGLYELGAELRESLLNAPESERSALLLALETCGAYHAFLSNTRAKMTAEGYNRLASLLDLGAVGTITLQNLTARREDFLKRLLMGGAGEALMLIGSLQYIKAWEQETHALIEQTAWKLQDILWRVSTAIHPGLSGSGRRRLLDSLLGPCLDGALQTNQRIAYLAWIFQLVLLITLSNGSSDALAVG